MDDEAALRVPRAAIAPAINSAAWKEGAPISCAVAPAGLVSGPSRLKTVRILRSHADRLGVLHGGVDGGGEQEADADFADGARGIVRRHVDADAPGFQQVGAAALAGDGAIAVLGDVDAGAGHHERGDGGDVKGVGAVAAGAAGIEQGLALSRPGSIGTAMPRMARAKPTSSSTVSPFIFRAIRKAAICGVAGLAAQDDLHGGLGVGGRKMLCSDERDQVGRSDMIY